METNQVTHMAMDGIFTDTSIAVLLVASSLTFFAYQVIPAQLVQLRQITEVRNLRGSVAKLVTGDAFKHFINLCGVDHLLTATVMFLDHHGRLGGEVAWGWLLAGSEISVATASLISALTIRLEIKRLKGGAA